MTGPGRMHVVPACGRLRCALAGLAIGIAACASEGDPTSPSALRGTWHFTLSASNEAAGVSCAAEGTLRLTVRKSVITGTGDFPRHCSGADVATVVSHHFTGEMLDATTLWWDDTARCTYTGRRVSADVLEGDVVCVVPFAGHDLTLAGTWRATR